MSVVNKLYKNWGEFVKGKYILLWMKKWLEEEIEDLEFQGYPKHKYGRKYFQEVFWIEDDPKSLRNPLDEIVDMLSDIAYEYNLPLSIYWEDGYITIELENQDAEEEIQYDE